MIAAPHSPGAQVTTDLRDKAAPLTPPEIDGAALPSARAGAAPAGLPQPQRACAVAVVLTAMAIVVLDASMATIALPTLAASLHVAPAGAVLVITAYQAALIMALLPCAAFGERFGYRRVFGVGVAVFTTASALCALAPSFPWLVAARFMQGLGGAAILALGVALLRAALPDGRLGAAIGWNALTVAVSAAAGPTLGALILSRMDWPWLYLVNLPLGLIVLLSARMLPAVPGRARQIDGASISLNCAVFGFLIAGAEILLTAPIAAALLFAAAGLGLIALVRRESPKAAPLIPLDLLRLRSFRFSVIASVCCFAGQTAGLVALPFHLQHVLAKTPLMTGLHMTPWPLGVMVTAMIAGRLADRMSTAWLCVSGAACLSLGLAAAALWPLHAASGMLVPITLTCGLGFGLFQVANNRTLFLSAPQDRSAAAGGMQGTARLLGQISGALLMTILLTFLPMDSAPRFGLGIASVLVLIAGLVSALSVRKR